MPSYNLKRRAFVMGLGGAFGARLLLKNLEAAEQGAPSPPRLLVAFWPGGTVHYNFNPIGAGREYMASRILQPLEDLGLRDDMIVLQNMHMRGLQGVGGGAGEAGVVFMTTGKSSPGTRQNGGETDDSIAGGPSFDQIFLRRVPGMTAAGIGYLNVTCDDRVDSHEVSSRCLSYSHDVRETAAANPSGGMLEENIPLRPELSPFDAYAKLFTGFAAGVTSDEALNALRMKQSVLDYATRDLDQLRQLAPVSERDKIDVHADAIRRAEKQLAASLEAQRGCGLDELVEPDPDLVAKTGDVNSSYGNPQAETGDESHLERLASDYFALIGVAFQCDILRVATFQWCPATNHVAFQGMYPGEPDTAYRHHPLGSAVFDHNAFISVSSDTREAEIAEFLTNAHVWFNRKLGEQLVPFKTMTDVFGGTLLDHMVVPYVTEKSNMADARVPIPAILFGGKALGLIGGQYYDESRHTNDMWMTVAQALMGQEDPMALLADEDFYKTDIAPIKGLWQAP